MLRFRSARVVVLLLPVYAALSGCATNGSPDSPENTVERFLRLDFDGARLSPVTHRQVEPLVAWKGRPGWETVYVVSGYDITNANVQGNSAQVSVKYGMLGKAESAAWHGSNKPSPELTLELEENSAVTYKLSRTPSGWRITDPVLPPRVSPQALSSHIKSRTQVTKDVRLQETVQALDEMSR